MLDLQYIQKWQITNKKINKLSRSFAEIYKYCVRQYVALKMKQSVRNVGTYYTIYLFHNQSLEYIFHK